MPYPLAALRSLLPLGALPDVGELAVTGVTHDSRRVHPGDLYAALVGATTHGARFVAAAVRAGAVAVLTDGEGARMAQSQLPEGVPVIVVDHPRAWLGEIAAAVYNSPGPDLRMFGVTGTNGKTTTTYLLESGLRHAGLSTGLIGTVETRVGDEMIPSVRTTPEATDVHALLAVMRERGIQACVMEVSSHALAFGRADGIVFDVAGFTNLSQDHLDFHVDLEDYFSTKARLFTPARSACAVICVDTEHGRRLAAQTRLPATTVATSPVGHGRAPRSDPQMAEIAHDQHGRGRPERGGVAWTVHRRDGGYRLVSAGGAGVDLQVPLPGDFNVANAALAVGMLIEAGVDGDVAAAGVGTCPGVPGRMEPVRADVQDAPLALVDYAHTPDAIENVLRALRGAPSEQGGTLVAVVGAGGDRDRDKRRLMGAAAAGIANVVVVTDDNPRSEDPARIRAAVLAGARDVPPAGRARVLEVGDRRAAIRTALDQASGPADTVVVLGKGHEPGQEIAGVVYPFDDREVLREELLKRRSDEQA